jgi:hypothetical protein
MGRVFPIQPPHGLIGYGMASKKNRPRPFVLGKDFRSDGKERVTKGKDFLVHGGTKLTHEETVDIVNEFSKRLRKEGCADAPTAEAILKEVLHERRQRN